MSLVRSVRTVAVLVLVAACRQAPATGTLAPAAAPGFPSGTLVDLSHTFDGSTIFWPTADPFRLEKVADGVTPGGYYYAANNFFSSEHGGTHLDAPVHFAKGAQAVDQVPLDRLVGAAVVIDVVQSSDGNADYQVTTDDVLRAEREQGEIPAGAIVLI